MSDAPIPVTLTLKNESGKEIDRVTIDVPPGNYEFNGLSPGKTYSVTGIPPSGWHFKTDNPWYQTAGDDGRVLGDITKEIIFGTPSGSPPDPIPPPEPPDPPPPLPEMIAVATISMVLMGNLALFEDIFPLPEIDLLKPFQPRPTQPRPSRPGQSPEEPPTEEELRDPRNRLPPELEERLRSCLNSKIKELLQIRDPSISDLVKELTKDNETFNSEFQVKVRLLYEKVQQLKKLIEECDTSLLKDLMEADKQIIEQRQSQSQCNATGTIVAEVVNVRSAPSIEGEIMGQFFYGSCVQLDTEILNSFSDEQRLAAEHGQGWYPVVLPDGQRGYVYSLYIVRTINYKFWR